MMTAPLESILYDPLSWMHPAWLSLPDDITAIRQRASVNTLIIKGMGLSVERPTFGRYSLAAKMIDYWQLLPQVAYLLACQQQRARLICKGGLQGLPDWVRTFATLALIPSSLAMPAAALVPAQLAGLGKKALLAYRSMLPDSLGQRIKLLFPPAIPSSTAPLAGDVDGILLFNLALQHAQRHPDTPDAAGFWRYLNQTAAPGPAETRS